MKKNARFFGVALAGVVALLLPLKADASCGTGIAFGSYYSSLVNTTNGPSLRANFWLLNEGNPAIGPGIDNGPTTDSGNWIIQYDLAGGPAIFGDWATITTYDGCPNTSATPVGSQTMVVSLSDVNAAGAMTYAVVCAHRDPLAPSGKQFSFDIPAGCLGAACSEFPLVLAARGAITNTVRAGNEVTVTIGSPNFAPGFYGDGSPTCTAAQAIPQYDVFKQTTARGTPPNPANDAGANWVLVGTGNTGSPVQVTTTCGATNCDNYFAVVPHYNSGFTTADAATGGPARVSAASANVQAGPTLAETPKPKKIKNEQIGPKKLQN